MQFCPKPQSAAWGPTTERNITLPVLTGSCATAQRKMKMPAPCLKCVWSFYDRESRELNQAQRPAHLHRPPTTTPPRLEDLVHSVGLSSAIKMSLCFYCHERHCLFASMWLGVTRPHKPRSYTPTLPASPPTRPPATSPSMSCAIEAGPFRLFRIIVLSLPQALLSFPFSTLHSHPRLLLSPAAGK